MEKKVQEFDVSSATVELAARALYCEPQRICGMGGRLQGILREWKSSYMG